jgi:hypothetical protein
MSQRRGAERTSPAVECLRFSEVFDFALSKIIQIQQSPTTFTRKIGPACGFPSASRNSPKIARSILITGT